MTDTTYDRRAFMSYFSSIGLGATLLPGVLWAQAGGGQQPGPEITKEMIASAEEIAGLKFSDDERAAMANGLRQTRANIQQLQAVMSVKAEGLRGWATDTIAAEVASNNCRADYATWVCSSCCRRG